MRSNVFFLAIGLFVADSALAGPCKPRTSTSEEVTAISTAISTATSETATTVLGTSSDVLSDIATTVSSDATSATTVAVENALTTSEVETSTAIDSTITADTTTVAGTTTIADTTVVADTTTTTDPTTVADTTTVAESTTTAPGSIPTYSFRVDGGPIDGATPQGDDDRGSTLTFTPNDNVRDRRYVIEPSTGRLKDTDTGTYICAFYPLVLTTSDPAVVANCGSDDQTGDDKHYNFMTCKVDNGVLSCTAPRGTCEFDNDIGDEVCTTLPGVIDRFYYQHRPAGANVWFIGTANTDAEYTSITLAATET